MNKHGIAIMEGIISKEKFRLTDKAREWLIHGICLVCLFLFLSTAYFKLTEHHRFERGLSRVELIGSFAGYLAWMVPVTESLVAALLIIPQTYKWGLYAFTGLMTLFTGYIVSMVLWAKKLPCHCGGAIEKLSWTAHIWFNLAFIALAIFALRLAKTEVYLNKTTK